MKLMHEIPPTAGLPMRWSDWLPTLKNITSILSQQWQLPPLQLECSGTVAFIVALKTLLDMEDNDGRNEIIIPAYTCPLVVLAISYCNLVPIVCDTEIDSFDFDKEALKRLVNKNTLAIVPTHLGGRIADVDYCVTLARQFKCYVIEDAAQALGASVGDKGDIVFFSLAVGKGLTLYEGGLLTSTSQIMRDALYKTHKKNIPHKFMFEIRRVFELFGYMCVYNPTLLNLFYGIPRRRALKQNELLNAVGDYFDDKIPLHSVSKFRSKRGVRAAERLPVFLKEANQRAIYRIKLLQQIKGIKVIGSAELDRGIWPFFMVLFPDKNLRDAVLEKLWTSPYGVTRLFINALTHYDYLKPHMGVQKACPNAVRLSSRMITISNSPWLSDDAFKVICQTIDDVLSRRAAD